MSGRMNYLALGLSITLALGCSDDDDPCDPVAQDGCDEGLVCEEVAGAEPGCFEPVMVRGTVFDLADDEPVAGARVVALDPNQSPASSVSVSDADGSYELGIPVPRQADGTPSGYDVTLRSDAAGYQTFPGGVRQALPIDASVAVRDGDDGPWVVETALTAIGLVALGDDAGLASIHGTVEVPASRVGVLVVAEGSGRGYSAIADREGDYVVFNLAAGAYDVQAYGRGVTYQSVGVTVAGDDSADVDLAIDDGETATLNGSIQIVNAGGGVGTSIILVVESTFDEALVRGDSPPGLRAPNSGLAPDVSGAFVIDGIPPGRYVVLAAFENDLLVRDPDPCIGGTQIVHQEFGRGQAVTMDDSFKVTGSLDVIGPGADGAELITGTPVLSWVDDSSEQAYDITVLDSFGEAVWHERIAGVSGGDVQLPYGGAALDPGMYYQFRVVSIRRVGEPTECRISQTEDLKGVFYVE